MKKLILLTGLLASTLAAQTNLTIYSSPAGTPGGASVGGVFFQDKAASNTVKLSAPDTMSGNVSFRLPAADGSAGSCLATDGAGNLSLTGTCSTLAAPYVFPGTTTGSIVTITQSGAGTALNVSGPAVFANGVLVCGGSTSCPATPYDPYGVAVAINTSINPWEIIGTGAFGDTPIHDWLGFEGPVFRIKGGGNITGTFTSSGSTVTEATWTGGTPSFSYVPLGDPFIVGATTYTVASVISSTQITVTPAIGTSSGSFTLQTGDYFDCTRANATNTGVFRQHEFQCRDSSGNVLLDYSAFYGYAAALWSFTGEVSVSGLLVNTTNDSSGYYAQFGGGIEQKTTTANILSYGTAANSITAPNGGVNAGTTYSIATNLAFRYSASHVQWSDNNGSTWTNIPAAGGAVASVTGTGPITVSPTTGATVVTCCAANSIYNSYLVSSSLTYSAGNQMTGGGLVSLGGSATLGVTTTPSFSTVTATQTSGWPIYSYGGIYMSNSGASIYSAGNFNTALGYSVGGYTAIDASRNFTGGTVLGTTFTGSSYVIGSGVGTVINTSGAFVGQGVNVGSNGISGGAYAVSGTFVINTSGVFLAGGVAGVSGSTCTVWANGICTHL